ncbi:MULTISPECIES: restriction endonuclease subunit S [unclassified Psychrobacter]|uniref:restriction endonuclease subunit S n=1 Tax=unclassified Psychrobacter TaxID=196806 RepID=UPI000414C18C|nr:MULTISPECIES: restriction endonuclease subunit S [unclassified Psychrobacter]
MNKTLEDACHIRTGKLNANAAVEGGIYPFFTCAEYPDEIDHYAFDDNVVLVAGNNASGNFHVNRYEGKFNAYQRTYILTAKAGYNIDFIYYALKLELKRLREKAQGSQTKFLTMPILTSISLRNITYDEQCDIANKLIVIDKKIKTNNQVNAELEAIAKTLYDYWFVQFDFSNAEGKPYKSSGGKMAYSEMLNREIPEEWNVKPLRDITSVSNDSIDPAKNSEMIFKLYSIPVFDVTSSYSIEKGISIGSNKFTVKELDLLVSKLNPWFNRVVYALDLQDQICSTEFVVWRCPNLAIKNFMYLIATSDQFIAHCTQSATGTSNSHKRVNPNVMMSFVQPFDQKIAEKFGETIDPMIKTIMVNRQENLQLEKLRDWLLPMLMNGQVTVS